MDVYKIGKFISERRKRVGLTQAQLAEQLNITDKAVSKWETGKALPDASIMLRLSDILKITVNDLLCGEVITVENYEKELEKKLVEMVKEKEASDRLLLRLEVVLGILSIIVFMVPIFAGAFLPVEDWIRVVIVFSGMIPGGIGLFFALRLEQVAGYYECRLCGHRYVPLYKKMVMAPHMGRTRHMKCPKCGKKSWQRKVVSMDGDSEEPRTK